MGTLLFEWLKQLPTVAVGVLAVFYAYRLITLTKRQVDVAQQEVDISQRQIQQAQESQYDQYRPMLIPNTESQTPTFVEMGHYNASGPIRVPVVKSFQLHFDPLHQEHEPDRWYVNFNSKYTAWLCNIGTGPALSIRGVIFPPKPEGPLDDRPLHQFFKFDKPIVPGEVDGQMSERSDILSDGNAMIGRYTLCAPPSPLPGTRASEQPYPLARLIVTYKDVFGRKHASVFHYTTQNEWVGVDEAFLRGITTDLDDLIQEELQRLLPVFQPTAPVQLPDEAT